MMECHSRSLAIAFASLLLAAAARAQSVPAARAENGQTWLVELSNPPAAEGGSASALQSEKRAFRSAAANAGIAMRERFSFDTLWNGISVRADASQLSALQHLPGVKNVWRAVSLSIPPTSPVADPDLITAITMTGADVVQSQLGYTGKGVKVAVIDTGIDYGHPDLGGCFGPGCRVAKGYDLVGNDYNADTGAAPVPDNDPMDNCAGHGTHVSGIIGASGNPATGGIRGVAPGVTFFAYRVFGCVGTTDSSIMIEAMERALNDGAQIVNMSIGAAFQTWPQYPTAAASDRL